MDTVKIVQIKEDITSRNNAFAKVVKETLKDKKVFLVNVMASPGSGKTTLLLELIKRLKAEFSIGVIEADIDSDVDAKRISESGVKTIQMHTMGACHITCQMSYEALEALDTNGLDLVFLENVGNLVCPAEFDTGANMNLVLLSVPEGDDKPLKYPLMFEVASVVALTKTDVMPVFDFSIEKAKANVKKRNQIAEVFALCAKSGEGVDALAEYIKEQVRNTINE